MGDENSRLCQMLLRNKKKDNVGQGEEKDSKGASRGQ